MAKKIEDYSINIQIGQAGLNLRLAYNGLERPACIRDYRRYSEMLDVASEFVEKQLITMYSQRNEKRRLMRNQERVRKGEPLPTLEMSHKDIVNMLRGTYPGYDIVDRIISMGLGCYVGGQGDHFEWHYATDSRWGKYSIEALYYLYLDITHDAADGSITPQ